MISVDTNIVVRLLTKDDSEQYQQSLKLFQNENVFICDSVILETEWVLRFAYKFSSSKICQAFVKLFGLPNVYLADTARIVKVLEWHQNGLDFADALHLANSKSCTKLYTFDRQFFRDAKDLTQCQVKQP